MGSQSDGNRDEAWMHRALEEARRAEGRTSPNPMVGCVITREGALAATGYHRRPGEAHAEIDALANLDGDPEGCHLYVNLEPCAHHGRTPPCVEALIEANIDRVVIGCRDPDPRVRGDGIEALRDAGIEVVVGVLEAEARRLNRPYFVYVTRQRPWISVKYAMSLDGKIATRTGDSAWISNETSRRRVHAMRDTYDAILVGTGTLKSDNPRLTSRIEGGRDPTRIVLDARLEAPMDSNVYQTDASEAETLVVTSSEADADRRVQLREQSVETITVPTDDRGFLAWPPLLEILADREIMRLFVEGGGTVIGTLIDEGRVDRVYAFIGTTVIGGREAPGPVGGRGAKTMREALEFEDVTHEHLEGDILTTADVTTSIEAVDP